MWKSLSNRWFLSLTTCAIATISTLLGWPMQTFITAFLYLIVSFFVLRRSKDKEKSSLIVLAVPFLVIYTIGSIINGAAPTYVISAAAFIGIGLGFLTARIVEPKRRLATLGILLLIFPFASFIASKNWIAFMRSEYYFKGKQLEYVDLFDDNDNIVSLKAFEGKTIVLDFWSTTCGPCIKKFPELQSLYQKYKSDTSIVIYSVSLPIPGDNKDKLRTFGGINKFSFPKLHAYDNAVWEKLNIEYLPCVMIIDRSQRIKYQGSFRTEWPYIFTNINSVIKKVRNE